MQEVAVTAGHGFRDDRISGDLLIEQTMVSGVLLSMYTYVQVRRLAGTRVYTL